MNWRRVTISLMVISAVLALLNTLALPPLIHREPFVEGFTGEDSEMGFYDMLAQQRELYHPYFVIEDNQTFLTLSSPEDDTFLMKVKMIPDRMTPEGMLFNYQPLFTANMENHPLFSNLLNFQANNGIVVDGFTFEGRSMLVTSYGLIMTQK